MLDLLALSEGAGPVGEVSSGRPSIGARVSIESLVGHAVCKCSTLSRRHLRSSSRIPAFATWHTHLLTALLRPRCHCELSHHQTPRLSWSQINLLIAWRIPTTKISGHPTTAHDTKPGPADQPQRTSVYDPPHPIAVHPSFLQFDYNSQLSYLVLNLFCSRGFCDCQGARLTSRFEPGLTGRGRGRRKARISIVLSRKHLFSDPKKAVAVLRLTT